ncbi:hypothetical protein CDD81_2895 [Ophiocordyceps australis]|uniref:Pentacotripeptide-repeat region of PRORP domain-containing protein n=1 Tax=Ophiocordyceps australis TaxID=1399860 RepID=A0A2C5XVW2_9HYPO|nr:hypothetical protein CDD81_2895 [Ophiocordyceps australis]
MKTVSRADGPIRGALRVNRQSASLTKIHASRQSLCKPAAIFQEQRRRASKRPNSCPSTSTWLLSTFWQPKLRCSSAIATAAVGDATWPTPPSSATASPACQDKKYLLSLVTDTQQGSVEDHLKFHNDPYLRGYAQPDGPRLTVSERHQDVEFPSAQETMWANDSVRPILLRLYLAIAHRLRRPHRVALGPIYNLYQQLPQPRMLNLTWQWRSRLLKAMGTPRKPHLKAMLRYFELVADTKNAGLTLRRSQWNHALNLAAKHTAPTSHREMESTLDLWKQMELDAHIPGNEVTFNILFNVATKAGNFTLADLIFREMETRGIELNRYHHVSLIHYFGLKLDSEGIRAAYKEMVQAGEVIDTVVLNCVISGLLRCGEEAEAEETYKRMRDSHSLAPDLPQRSYMTNKVITQALLMFSRISRQHPKLRGHFQNGVHLAPDLHTYKLLVEHYAIRLGSLSKVAKSLDEMKYLKISVHPTIFLILFKGFYVHGGFQGSDWSAYRLEGVMEALYAIHDQHARHFRLGRWLVIWALRAVRHCAGTEDLKRHFAALAQRWDVPPDSHAFMHGIYDSILSGRDLKSQSSDCGQTTNWRSRNDGSWL